MMPLDPRLAFVSRAWGMIWFSIRLHYEALTQALCREGLAAFTRLNQIRDDASAKLFSVTSPGFISFENTTVVPSLVHSATGVILDLGPGPGNQIHRFDSSAVEFVYGVEPNPHYKADIDAKLQEHGLQDRYKLLTCRIEDSDVLRREGIEEGTLDTVLCIQVLCAVKDPKSVMKEVWKLLKPGGKFIYWEHGCSRNWVTGWVQAIMNPAWNTFVGCHLKRNVMADILDAGEWENPEKVQEPEDPYSCLPRIQGVLVKRV